MIRPRTDADMEELLDAWYRASLVAHSFLSEEFYETERCLIAEQWLPQAETIVYETDGRVVGFLSLTGNEVGGFFVDPDYHGQGIGRALMDRARDSRSFSWGGAAIADPAQDLAPAWAVLDSRGRRVFRDAVEADDATWLRARAFELEHAVGGVLYYSARDHPLAEVMARTLHRILDDG